MALGTITRGAVLAAIAEYDRLGQEEFLRRYGFDRARQYVLVYDGKRYDSKAIVGVAYGFLPGKAPLAASEFSGGKATVGHLLTRLGFHVEMGDEQPVDVLIRQLMTLRVYRRDGLPALYQPITLLWAFARARRGEDRLVSWTETKRQVGSLLRRYGQADERDRVHYPIAALCGAGLWELGTAPETVPTAHGSSVPQRWFDEHQPNGGLVEPVYTLIRESPEALTAAVNTLIEKYFVAADATGLVAELGLTEPAETSPRGSRQGDWTEAENRAIVGDYLAMLTLECASQPYSKTEHRNALIEAMGATRMLSGTLGAHEVPGFRHCVCR